MNLKNHKLLLTIFIVQMIAIVTPSFSTESAHSFYNRSLGLYKPIYLNQTIEGAVGEYTSKKQNTSTKWQGYGVKNAIGMELFRFIQLEMSHSLVNMDGSSKGIEKYSGSKIGGSIKLSFHSPIGNLEIGTGSHVGSYNYQKDLITSQVTGSGHLFSLGINHFFKSNLSISGTISSQNEKISKRKTTLNDNDSLQGTLKLLGVGLNIWI